MTRFEFQVEENFAKFRLEDYLCEKFPHLSKMYLRERVKYEKCEVNGVAENRGFKLKKDDFIEIEVDLDRETAMKPEAIPLEIIFGDVEILVVNKPAGMLVHPTHRDKTGTLSNALAFYLNQKEEEKGRKGVEKKIPAPISSSPPLLFSFLKSSVPDLFIVWINKLPV